MSIKKYIIITLASVFILSTNLKAETECFEKVSRVIFKFNQGFDKVILRPIAAGYKKLPKSGCIATLNPRIFC